MASITLPDGIKLLTGLEANLGSVIPDVAEPLFTQDTRRVLFGDNAEAGGWPINGAGARITTPAAHLFSLATPPHFLFAYIADVAGTVALARGATGQLPEFVIVRIASATELDIVPLEYMWRGANAHGVALGTMNWLAQGADSTLQQTEPTSGVIQPVGIAIDANTFHFRALSATQAVSPSTPSTRYTVPLSVTMGGSITAATHQLGADRKNLMVFNGDRRVDVRYDCTAAGDITWDTNGGPPITGEAIVER